MADRFKPGTKAWVRVIVNKPVDLYGCGRLLECGVIGTNGEPVDNGYIYLPEGSVMVQSVAQTTQERERAGERRPMGRPTSEAKDEW